MNVFLPCTLLYTLTGTQTRMRFYILILHNVFDLLACFKFYQKWNTLTFCLPPVSSSIANKTDTATWGSQGSGLHLTSDHAQGDSEQQASSQHRIRHHSISRLQHKNLFQSLYPSPYFFFLPHLASLVKIVESPSFVP